MKPRAATVQRKDRPSPNIPVRGRRILDHLFRQLCSHAGTPLAFRAYHLWRNGEIKELMALDVDPFFYSWNARYDEFELDVQVVSFWKKFPGFDLGIDRKALAYAKWLKAEQSCERINMFFRDRWEGRSKPLPFPVEEILHLARRKITDLLGTVKMRDLDYLRKECRHGPGSDLSLVRTRSTSYEKYRSPGDITEPCSRLYDDIFGCEFEGHQKQVEPLELGPDHRQNFAHDAQIVEHNRLAFVPKTARIDRAICVEPRWNVFLQLGIGALISKRLLRCGQDIQNQGRNQEAARKAYSEGLSTLDLSSASDTVATNLVIDLLSSADPIWLDMILKGRCHSTKYKGKSIRLEKISSMGNGYTFPLETLIFYAFAWATVKFEKLDTAQVEVFGDDIIVPRGAFSQLVEVLEAFGFSVNTDKSYASGDFFESCGKDYFRGREVRPFFVKKDVVHLADAMTLHNQVLDWAGRNRASGTYSQKRASLCDIIINEIPIRSRLYGPVGLSGVFHATLSRLGPLKPAKNGWEGYWIRILHPKYDSRKKYDFWGHLWSKLAADIDCQNRVLLPTELVYRVSNALAPLIEELVFED